MHVISQAALHSPAQLGDKAVAFVGRCLDERGDHARTMVEAACARPLLTKYVPESYQLRVGETSWRVNELDSLGRRHAATRIILDATTLDFPEILLIVRAYLTAQQRVEMLILYVEPKSYREVRNSEEPSATEFALSENYRPEMHAIPGFSPIIGRSGRQAHVVCFLGFESKRFAFLLEHLESQAVSRCTAVLGIPPFKTQWETHSLMQNAHALTNPVVDVRYAGANNPRSSYRLIQSLYEGRDRDNVFEVAPLGTKPAAVACALFAAEHRDVGIRFDYPKRAEGRTVGVAKGHVFHVRLAGFGR